MTMENLHVIGRIHGQSCDPITMKHGSRLDGHYVNVIWLRQYVTVAYKIATQWNPESKSLQKTIFERLFYKTTLTAASLEQFKH